MARDANNSLFYYVNHPTRGGDLWYASHGYWGFIDKTFFPDLKWEDNPIKVELTIRRV